MLGLELTINPFTLCPTYGQIADLPLAERDAVHVLCNNAGVMPVSRILDTDMADWRWAYDVYVFGMVHGIRAFVPRMVTQGTTAHVINTVSMAAFGSETDLAVYGSTKHACTAITEVLRTELADTPVRVCGLYPGGVLTDITNSGRNRAAQCGRPAAGLNSVPDSALRDDAHITEDLLNPIDVGRIVRLAVEQDTPWISTHPTGCRATHPMGRDRYCGARRPRRSPSRKRTDPPPWV
jgi:NADP-dependent 3-hydroxy acid dehydrogenase YdfG